MKYSSATGFGGIGIVKLHISCQDRAPVLQEIYCRYDNPMITLGKIHKGGAL